METQRNYRDEGERLDWTDGFESGKRTAQKEAQFDARYARPRRRPTGLLKFLVSLSVVVLAFMTILKYWPLIAAHIPSNAPVIVISTAQPASARPLPPRAPATGGGITIGESPVIVPLAPVPNMDTTNDPAPVLRQSVEIDRQPAGANVPTAEPVVVAESGGTFGIKPVIVNPQATHECKHGQVWIDGKGCKNQ